MNTLMMVLTLLSWIAPKLTEVIAAIEKSNSGGVEGYDKILAVAKEKVKEVSVLANATEGMPGGPDSGWARNLRLYSTAIYKTVDALDKARVAYKDHQVSQAVGDAYTAWKMETK